MADAAMCYHKSTRPIHLSLKLNDTHSSHTAGSADSRQQQDRYNRCARPAHLSALTSLVKDTAWWHTKSVHTGKSNSGTTGASGLQIFQP